MDGLRYLDILFLETKLCIPILKLPSLTIVLHGAAIREETGFEEMQALKIHSKMYSSL